MIALAVALLAAGAGATALPSSSSSSERGFIITLIIIVISILLLLSCKIFEYFLNLFLFPRLLSSSIFPQLKVHINFFPLQISLSQLLFELPLLEQMNKALHLNCQFDLLSIDSIQVTILPRIGVNISGMKLRAFSQAPNDWSKEEIEEALSANRLETLDSLTAIILNKLHQMKTGRSGDGEEGGGGSNQSNSWLYLPMHWVDLLIATAVLEMKSTSVSFCARRSGQLDDVLLCVGIERLFVSPIGPLTTHLLDPMFEVCLSFSGREAVSVDRSSLF
jgi:hypothetical protein